jgi:beta-phosphoglucomutase-like phosphatase (HAD superfamily)
VPIDLVIFDCDGVPVASEIISCRAHAEGEAELGRRARDLRRYAAIACLHRAESRSDRWIFGALAYI